LGPSLPSVSNIEVSDNGNAGDGSDIEVIFEEQSDQSNIQEYRIVVSKATSTNNLNVDFVSNLDARSYAGESPDEVFPVRGITLLSSTTDTDGDPIKEGTGYIVSVLTVSKDEILSSNFLTVDNRVFTLTQNNLVSNYTIQFDGGAGSLVIDNDDSLYMGHYNIVDHLSGVEEEVYPVYQIGETGAVSEYITNLPLMTGSAIDSKGNLYHSLLFKEEILKIENNSTTRIGTGNRFLTSPDGLYLDNEDNLFVVTQNIDHLLKIDQNGEVEIIARIPESPRGITGDYNGNIYISHNHKNGIITKVTKEGEVSVLAQIPTFKPESYVLDYLMWVGYISFFEGALYVAGMSTDIIYKVNLDGSVENFVGSGLRGIPRGDARTARLNRPIGLAFSKDGKKLYISVSADIEPRHTQSTTPAQIIEVSLLE